MVDNEHIIFCSCMLSAVFFWRSLVHICFASASMLTLTSCMQGQLPSVPFHEDRIHGALFALQVAFREQLEETHTRTRALKLIDAANMAPGSYVGSRYTPNILRTRWPQKAVQFMQTMDELQAEWLKDVDIVQAAETSFAEKMLHREDKLQELSKAAVETFPGMQKPY